MTPEQFSRLSEGDLIRNKNGHGFFVLENKGCAALAQCILSVPRSRSEDWTLCARLEPVPQPPSPSLAPKVESPKRPPYEIMHRRVLDAGGLAIESKDDKKYRICGRVFNTLEAAWDTLPKVTRKQVGKNLLEMRYELRKVGWTMDDDGSPGPVVWTSPGVVDWSASSGIRKKSITGTRAAWDYVFGDDAP